MLKSRVHRYILLSENDVQVQTDAEGGQRQGAQEVEHDAGVYVQCTVEEHRDQGHAHQGHQALSEGDQGVDLAYFVLLGQFGDHSPAK